MVSNGETSSLERLPRPVLDRIIQQGISGETVAKCNGAPAKEDRPTMTVLDHDGDPLEVEASPEGEDPPSDNSDDLPAAWNI
jgi:hypothetical protein